VERTCFGVIDHRTGLASCSTVPQTSEDFITECLRLPEDSMNSGFGSFDEG
jgi:hypothetical protein